MHVEETAPLVRDRRRTSRRILFIGGFDSTNHVYVELVRAFEARGHSCDVLVDNPHDAANNTMFVEAGIPMMRLAGFPADGVTHYDVVFSGPFLRRPTRPLFKRMEQGRPFLISFATLFSSVTMRVPADLVITSATGRFEELARNGLDYRMVAVGNPQYDPLVRAKIERSGARPSRIRSVLVVDQGAYPVGKVGKSRLAEALKALAMANPGVRFDVKPRYLPGHSGDQLHSVSDHLFHFLDDRPDNLRLLETAGVLERMLPAYDAMVTTWSTAHLAAAVLDIPLMLIEGIESVDVYDVRTSRVRAAYDRLRDTGCVIHVDDLPIDVSSLRRVDGTYIAQEIRDPGAPAAPHVVDLVEAICAHLLDQGLSLAGSVHLDHAEFVAGLAQGVLPTRALGSAEDLRVRRTYRELNALAQELVFQNRCMGHVLDVEAVLPLWRPLMDPDASDETMEQVRAEAPRLIGELKRRYFEAHPREVASDLFVQDAYFDWLRQTGRTRELLGFEGPVVCGESLAYNRGIHWLKRGRLVRASRSITGSFAISLAKPVRETKKDRRISVLLSRTNRSLLAHVILLSLNVYRHWDALASLEVPDSPGADAVVLYRMRALVALGRSAEAIEVGRDYERSHRIPAGLRGRGARGLLLHVVILGHWAMRREYLRRLEMSAGGRGAVRATLRDRV